MNINNIYIHKSNGFCWYCANELYEFFKNTCKILGKEYFDEDFISVLHSSGYKIKNLGDNPSVVDYLRIGEKIEAIKRFKELNHCSLLEAKNEVEKLLDKYWNNMGE